MSGRQQFFTWMAVDQLTGHIYIVFYDRRNTSGDTTDVFVAKSVDGGETFTNFQVNTESYVPKSNVFFGDYTNIAALNGRVYPIWMRMDVEALSVWTAIIDERKTMDFAVNEGWNLLSVPMFLDDYSNTNLFPTAVSNAFRFDGTYEGILSTGKNFGFWMKFYNPQVISIKGVNVTFDSIDIKPGWNIIGSISKPVIVSEIESNPPGMVLSEFFQYSYSSYSETDTLYPFNGYWVKSDRAGKLIFRESAGESSENRIIIRSPGELPPPPPDDVQANIVHQFALHQNFPNPFNPTTKMSFFNCQLSLVVLKVFDILGRELATLVNEIKAPGIYYAEWDGSKYPSGVYYYKLSAGNFTDVKKMVLVK
jgi:hypothetical protein